MTLSGLLGRVVVIASAAVVLLAGPARAQTVVPPEPMPTVPGITAAPQPAQPGQTIEITGGGFGPCASAGSAMTLRWNGTTAVEGVSIDEDGGFRTDLTVPEDAPDDEYVVVAECSYAPATRSGSAELLSASTQVEVLCAVGCPADLSVSSSEAAAGDLVTVTGDGYLQCTRMDSAVQLLWDGQTLVGVARPDADGRISVDVRVPNGASSRHHAIAARCYDPATGYVTSDPLAAAGLAVVPGAGPDAGPSPPTKNGSPPSTGSPSPGTGSPPPTSASSPAPAASSRPSTGALVVISAAAVLLVALLVVLRAVRRPRRRRDWVRAHVRVAPRPLGRAVTEIRDVTGAKSLSVGLQPRSDQRGRQTTEEVPA